MFDDYYCKKEFLCDVYPISIYPEDIPELYKFYKDQLAYWAKWFGNDRNDNPKGIIEFQF